MKVHEYAKERGLTSKDISEALTTLIETEVIPEGTSTSASSKLDENELAALNEYFKAADGVLEEEAEATDDQEAEETTGETEEEAVEPEVEEVEQASSIQNFRVSLKGNISREYETDSQEKAIELYKADVGILSTPYEFSVEVID